ncbi:hypothetical protein PENTCL1PPCAC_30058, partial [Pristionchus entomophagus]
IVSLRTGRCEVVMSSTTARKSSVLRRFSSSISDLLSIQKRVEDEKETPLHNAILMGNMATLKQLIQNSICDVDQENEKGHTALHIAMEQHGTEAASILLANGASPDATDFSEVTPAHIACAAGNIDTFDLLLYYKADVCAVNKAGRTPLDSASEQGRLMMVEKILESGLPIDFLKKSGDRHVASALHLAARMGHVQVVSALLKYGWEIDRITDKGTALHEAASHGRTQVVRLLLHMGIDPSVINSRGMTAYDCAKKSSSRNPISSKEIRTLLKNQSSFSYAEAIIDYNGETADELTLTRGDILWVIDKGHGDEVRYRGVIFGEKGNSRCGYLDRTAVRAIERPASVISVPNNRFSGMPLHAGSTAPRAPMKVDVPLPPNMKGHMSTSHLHPQRDESMIRQNSSPLPTLSQNNSVSTRSMSRISNDRPSNDANGNRIRQAAPQYTYNNSNVRMSTFKSGMTTSMTPISLSSPIDQSHYGGTVNSPRDSTGSNSSGFESLKGVSGNNSASPSHASFRSATTMLVDSPQSRISMNSSHSNESSGPSSHSSCSVDTLDDALLPLDVTSMVQKGINEGEILALWFERLGHTEYLSLFLTQGYDLASIARITPEDLITLGIKNPQHRMKLMAEIHSWNLTDSWPDSVPPGGLREWLSLMGMPEYGDSFESQGYDSVEKIHKLCWEDFEDIGVKRLGHLKRLQLALKKLKNKNMLPAQQTRSTSSFASVSPFNNTHQIYSRADPPPPAPVSILKKPSSAMSEIDYFSYTRNGAMSQYSDPLFAERRRQPLNLNLTATSKILSDRSIIEQLPNCSYTGSGVDCPPPPAPLSYESTRRLKDPSWDSSHSSTSTLHAQPLFADADDTGTIRARQKAKPLPPEHLISRIGLGSTFFQDPLPINDDPDEDPLGDVSNMLENLMHDLEAHTKPANRRSTECPGSFPV